MNDVQMCACGQVPLRYNSKAVETQVQRLVDELGEYQPVTVSGEGTWLVSRHCIALHGIKASDLPSSAWVKIA